jgi:acyl carrier protein
MPSRPRNIPSRMEDIDIDSVDFLNFVIGLHKELNVDIPDADVAKLTTLNGCVAYLLAKTGRY